MKIRTYGALTSAFLLTLTTGSAQATDCAACACPPPKAAHHAAARPAPAQFVRRRNADAEAYVKSFYDYNSAEAVSEVLARRLESSLPPPQPWEVAPNDAHIRFRPYDTGVGYAPAGQVAINDNDFTGGVGNHGGAGGGGGGSGFMDGYGQVHFADGGGRENGPTYNNYPQSFSTGGFSEGRFGSMQSGIWDGAKAPTGPRPGY